ncbi:hypothetical protein [Halosimplex halophilum]|uniref:hypothetical protein n=1 Tax=Halosimplex halophilum TaxID=2559572 RepID=UPI001FE748A3|nr:hypothetical protein [Halosimplex halophilum]
MTDEPTTTPTTDTTTDTVGDAAPKATMAEFSHTNPHTGKAFGDDFAFQRGPAVAADGGRADAETDEQTMEDVDHEHPDDDAADANRVFQRGEEGRDGSV